MIETIILILIVIAFILIIYLFFDYVIRLIRKSKYKSEPINSIAEPMQNKKSNVVVNSSNRRFQRFVVILVIVLGLTLPFHYFPYAGMVFPKNNLTLSNTFITNDDIKLIVDRYNAANNDEKLAMKNEPFFRKLMEKGLVKDSVIFNPLN